MNRLIRSMISTIGMSRISGRISALNSMKINKARSTIYTTDHILENSRNFGDMDLADALNARLPPRICSRSHSLPFLLLICSSPYKKDLLAGALNYTAPLPQLISVFPNTNNMRIIAQNPKCDNIKTRSGRSSWKRAKKSCCFKGLLNAHYMHVYPPSTGSITPVT